MMRDELRYAPKMHSTIISGRIPPCSVILMFRSDGRTIRSIPHREIPIASRRKSCWDTPLSSGKLGRRRPKVRAGRGYGRRFACPQSAPIRRGGTVKVTDDRRISGRGDEIASGPESAIRLMPLQRAATGGCLMIRKPDAVLRDETIASSGRPLAEWGTRSDRCVSCASASRQRAQQNKIESLRRRAIQIERSCHLRGDRSAQASFGELSVFRFAERIDPVMPIVAETNDAGANRAVFWPLGARGHRSTARSTRTNHPTSRPSGPDMSKPRWRATVKMSLSPRPHMFMQMR